MAKTALTTFLVLAAALVPYGAARAATRVRPGPPAEPKTVLAAGSPLSSLTGVLAYVSNSDPYGSDGKETLVAELPDGAHKRTLLAPAGVEIGLLEFSPSGRRLAYFRATTSAAKVDVMDLATRKVVALFTLRGTGAYVAGLAWTPHGRDLIVGSNQRPGSSKVHAETALWRIPVDGGKATRVTSFEDAGDPTVMPGGDLVYIVSKTFSSTSNSIKSSAMWISHPDGFDAERVFTTTRFVDTPSVAPDGRTVAYTVVSSDSATHLASVTIASRRRRNLTRPVKGRTDISPSWSPNGEDIVFLSSRAGRHGTTKSDQLLDAYVMTATGKDPRKVISRDGDKWSVVFVSWGS